MINVEIPNLAALVEKFRLAPDAVEATLENSVKAATAIMQVAAMKEAPKRTGKMAIAITGTSKGLAGVVSPNYKITPYAKYALTGTGIYGPSQQRIVPKNAKVLATKINPGWGTQNAGGYWIIGRSIAGMKANPFLERAEAAGMITVRALMTDVGKGIVEGLTV